MFKKDGQKEKLLLKSNRPLGNYSQKKTVKNSIQMYSGFALFCQLPRPDKYNARFRFFFGQNG